jgi:hypothetical protein
MITLMSLFIVGFAFWLFIKLGLFALKISVFLVAGIVLVGLGISYIGILLLAGGAAWGITRLVLNNR